MVEEHNAREVLFIPDSGIPKDRVIFCPGDREAILANLECLICNKIAHYPKKCVECEGLICTRCLESQKSEDTNQCPKAECEGNKLVSTENNKLLSLIISQIEFKCHNEECKDKLSYSELDKHLCKFDYFICKSPKCFQQFPRMLIDNHEATCEFILTRCRNTGCEEEVERGQMEEHIRKCDYRRIICPGCQELKLQKEITEHENICPKIQLECTYAECPLLIPRGDMEVHLVECDFRPLKCPDCEHEHPQKDIEEHKSRCPKANLPCSGCGYLLHREDIPAHHCLRYLADHLRSLDNIQVRKHKIIAHLVQREAEIETANNIIMQNQIVMNQKIDRIEKREADLERANMKYIQNSMDILKKTNEIEEKERKIEDVQKELKQGKEELNEKVFSLMEREKALVKNKWELKEEDRRIDHKLKILEEKAQQFENYSLMAMKTLKDKLKIVEEREIQRLKDVVRLEQKAEGINLRISILEKDGKIEQILKILEEKEINFKSSIMKTMEDKLKIVEKREIQLRKDTKSREERVEQRAEETHIRIRILEEYDARFTEGHKKQEEDNRIQERKLKEMEKKLKALEFRIRKQWQRLAKRRVNNQFYGYVSGSDDKSLIFMDNQLNVVHKHTGKTQKDIPEYSNYITT